MWQMAWCSSNEKRGRGARTWSCQDYRTPSLPWKHNTRDTAMTSKAEQQFVHCIVLGKPLKWSLNGSKCTMQCCSALERERTSTCGALDAMLKPARPKEWDTATGM